VNKIKTVDRDWSLKVQDGWIVSQTIHMLHELRRQKIPLELFISFENTAKHTDMFKTLLFDQVQCFREYGFFGLGGLSPYEE